MATVANILTAKGHIVYGEAIMDLHVYAVSPDMSVDQCMHIMTNRRARHLPVMEGKALVGLVSIGDTVKMQTLEHHSSIEQMTEYIQGRA
jgi:predicted transcriptional regulator